MGAGVKAPYTYGATDEFSYRSVDKVSTVYDLHATVLHLLGLDHTKLTYYHNGFERRLTDVHGHVIREVCEREVEWWFGINSSELETLHVRDPSRVRNA